MRRRTIALLSVTAAVALGGGVAVARSTGRARSSNSPEASKVIDQIDPSIPNGAGPAGFAPATGAAAAGRRPGVQRSVASSTR